MAWRTKSQLVNDVTTNYNDNIVGDITPADLRLVEGNEIDSFQQAPVVNAQFGTTYALTVDDYGKLIVFNNAAPVAVSLPQATGSFAVWNAVVANTGAGVVTITPAVSLIGGAATLVLLQGQSQGIVSDGVNYQLTHDSGGPFVKKSGDTMSGDLSISKSNAELVLDGTSNTAGILDYRRNGADRWIVRPANSESVTDLVGSDLQFSRANNAGVVQDAPLTLRRDTGRARLLGDPLDALDAATKAYVDASGGSGGAPNNAEYLVGASSSALTAERVVIDTPTVSWDFSTPGQAKANAATGSGDTQRSVKQPPFNAVGNGVADDTAAIQAAINATPFGGRLRIPEGQYRVTGTLTRTTPIQLWGDGPQGATIVVDAAFSSSADVFHFAPTTATVGWAVSGFQIQGASGTPRGRHAIHIDTVSGGQAYNFSIHNMVIQPTATGNSIRVTNADASGGLHNSQIFDNNIESLYLLNVGDTIAVRNNVITNSNTSSTNAGIYAYQVSGAGNLQIIGNNIATLAGHIIFDGGVLPIICNNELETPHLIANSRGFMIELLGTLDLVRGGVLSDNQIQVLPSTGNPIPIKIANAANVAYSGGRNSVQLGPHVQITSAATDTVIDRSLQYVTANVISLPVISDAGVRTVWRARSVLTGNRSYFVGGAGASDANNGLDVSTPFLTLQRAWDVVAGLDAAGFVVTVQIANGTYTGGVDISSWWTGGGTVIFQGNAGSPASVLHSVTSTNAWTINSAGVGVLRFKDFKIQTTTSGDHLFIRAPITFEYANMDFGAAAGVHIRAFHPGSKITALSSYTVSGGAIAHWLFLYSVMEVSPGVVITLSGVPAFGAAFIYLDSNAKFLMEDTTAIFSPTSGTIATGSRFLQKVFTAINVHGRGSNFFPGNAAGTTDPTSVYV